MNRHWAKHTVFINTPVNFQILVEWSHEHTSWVSGNRAFVKEADNADLQTHQILLYFIIYKIFGLYSQNQQRCDYWKHNKHGSEHLCAKNMVEIIINLVPIIAVNTCTFSSIPWGTIMNPSLGEGTEIQEWLAKGHTNSRCWKHQGNVNSKRT